MRIRKRFPPLSSLSSVPLSDPQLSRSLVVQPPHIQPHLHGNLCVQEDVKRNPNQSDPQNQLLQRPTGEEMMIGAENPVVACPPNSIQEQMKYKEIEGKEIKDERWKAEEEKKSSNDIIRKESISSAEVDMQFPQSSSSSCQAYDRWNEGDRVVPLKKRKASFERMGSKEMIKPKMKSKTNRKCLQQQNGQDVHDRETKVAYEEGGADTKNTTSSTKKSKRGSVIMEGSRCSRVNGRGWRCCQPTLVGYSLCEHHLGKGRLRSMTSVRNRATAHNITAAHEQQDHKHIEEEKTARLTQPNSHEKQQEMMTKSSSTNNTDHHDAADENERKPLMSRKKRVKIGAVKARSISSLLGQTDNAGAAAANRNKNSASSLS